MVVSKIFGASFQPQPLGKDEPYEILGCPRKLVKRVRISGL